MDYKLEKFEKFRDSRGDLIVFLKETQLDDAKKRFGQIYLVTFNHRGVIRGNHFHKKWHEWFGVIAGKVKVILVDVRTGEKKEMTLNADTHRYIRLETGPYIAHAFKSMTAYAALVNYADAEWDKNDSFYYKIL